MADAQFLNVYVKPKTGKTRDDVEVKLNNALDWFRYNPNVYILYTTTDVDTWQNRLLDLVKDDGSLFICPLDMKGYKGWMTQEFWDWIRKEGRAK